MTRSKALKRRRELVRADARQAANMQRRGQLRELLRQFAARTAKEQGVHTAQARERLQLINQMVRAAIANEKAVAS